MDEIPVVTIVHELPGRIRVRLSMAPKDHKRMIKSVKDHEGFESISYTPISRSLLIKFNSEQVKREEILVRIGLFLSLENEGKSVHIYSQPKNQEMSDSAFYSGISIVLALLYRMMNSAGGKISWTEWMAGGSTALAVIEHGWSEVKKNGNFDPEVLSVIYLLIALVKRNFLPAAILTWISTFGRHLIHIPPKGVELKPLEVVSEETGEKEYEVEVSTIMDEDNKMMLFSLIPSILKFAFAGESAFTGKNLINQIQKVSQFHGEVLHGIESFKNGIPLRFNLN